MYFESREQAGLLLADKLFEKYRYEDCAVVAITDGGVQVGEQIATKLHCVVTMLASEDIQIPGESLSFGAVSQSGDFTYNGSLSQGEIEGYVSEFHGYIEDQKREAFRRVNRLIGDRGTIDRDLLRGRHIILVSDGIDDGVAIDVAIDFLKPIQIQNLIVAAPVATVSAVDKIHVAADELQILDVKDNFLGTDHYYEKNDVPSHEEVIEKINKIILNWQ